MERADLYKKAIASSVAIERLNARGEKMGVGSGFFLGPGILVTAFQVLDGATTLRILMPDGSKLETQEILNWNRRQDWALLQIPAGTAPPLERAKADSWSVGDRCYSVSQATPGNWVIVPMDIIGKNQFAGAGERLNVSGGGAVGAPLLNEYGEVVGVMGGSLLPGANSLDGVRFGFSTGALLRSAYRGELAVPLSVVNLAAARRGTLDGLLKSGESTPPLEAHQHVISGTLSREVDRGKGLQSPIDERYEYYARDQHCFVLLGMNPKEKRDTMVTLRIFDIENRPLGTSKPSKLKLRKGEYMSVDWKLPVAGLRPGLYRIDVYFDEQPAWRSFFRILE